MAEILPVTDVLQPLCEALRDGPNAVLVAPPGAGKTTAVAPALLDEPWCSGEIWITSPRRIAARAAAERMAAMLGEKPGETVGYLTRMDSKRSAKTRIVVATEAIVKGRIIEAPDLPGIGALLFDEVHERSLDSDFALALALEAQEAFRPDLRLLAMSATLDGAAFAKLLGDAPVIESEGRSHPLEIRHVGRRAELRIEDDVAQRIRSIFTEMSTGDLLVFLPGVREIERTAEAIEALPAKLHILHGNVDPALQRAAIKRDPDGARKIILATSIAETSLTIDGVSMVLDCGLARRPRYDRANGSTRLVTERASQAAATQRAGRAARQGPGVAFRMWEKAATGGMAPYDPPEILESDLAPMLLDSLRWGEAEPEKLRWLDAPPAAGLAVARERLATMGATDEARRLTPLGEAIAQMTMPPELAAMLLRAAQVGEADKAAEVAILLQERGLGGRGEDLAARHERFAREGGGRAKAAKALAARWAKQAGQLAANLPGASGGAIPNEVGEWVAMAYPEKLAKRRDAKGEKWASVGGRAYRLDPTSPLASAEWLAVAEVQGIAASARIMSAAAIDGTRVEALFADRIARETSARYDRDKDRVELPQRRKLGALTLSEGPASERDDALVVATLLDALRSQGLGLLPWSDLALSLRQRAAFAGSEALSDAALLDSLNEWIAPLLSGKSGFGQVNAARLAEMLEARLGWDEKQRIDRLAPARFASPAGTTHPIDYAAEAGPTVELRVQALYGLAEHPTVGNERIPLVLSLTSPAGRPIQTTRDLPGFWAGSWRDVQKDMRGRYPKHHWPDDPTAAKANLRTKKKQGL